MVQDMYSIRIKTPKNPGGFIRCFIYFWYLVGSVAVFLGFYWHFTHGYFAQDIDQLTMQKVKDATFRLQREYVVSLRYKNENLGILLKVPGTLAYGTGFMVSQDGYLITCHHVVFNDNFELGAEVVNALLDWTVKEKKLNRKFIDIVDLRPQITVLNKKGDPWIAGIVEDRPDRDITLLRVDLKEKSDVSIPICDTKVLVGGESVWAIGFPTVADINAGPNDPNFLIHTVNQGNVSAIKQAENGCRFVQTDAELGQGMSGGPVINAFGQLIGVTSFGSIIKDMVEKAGYAIASDEVKFILRENSVMFSDVSK